MTKPGGSDYVQPLVSILINNYNYGQFVAEAIHSALNQSYPQCEILVVDDGSTDNSREVISSFGTAIRTIFQANGGQASAFNAGFANCGGDIICFLDSDDVFRPYKVEEVVDAMRGPGRQWYFHRLQWTDAMLTPIPTPPSDHDSGDYDFRASSRKGTLRFAPPSTSGLSFTRRMLEQILPMPESIKITSDNYMKYAALALAPGYFSVEQPALQRIHGANAYTKSENETLKADVLIGTAAALRERMPALRAACNRMYAEGLARKMLSGTTLRRTYKGSHDHLSTLPLSEKASILGRALCKVLRRQTRRLAGASL
jgi:hypothetical protein